MRRPLVRTAAWILGCLLLAVTGLSWLQYTTATTERSIVEQGPVVDSTIGPPGFLYESVPHASGLRVSPGPLPPPPAIAPKQPAPASEIERFSNRFAAALERDSDAHLLTLLEESREKLNPAERAVFCENVARCLAANDPPRAARLIEALPDLREQWRLTERLIHAMLTTPGAAPADWLAGMEPSPLAANAHRTLAREWSRTDLEATLSWLAGLEDERLTGAAVEGLLWTWAQTDMGTAALWADQIEDPGLRDKALLQGGKILARRDPSAASDWAMAFPAGETRDQALSYAIHQWAEEDLFAAAEWILELDDPSAQDGALAALGAAWGNSDPAAALRWATDLPESVRERAVALATTKLERANR